VEVEVRSPRELEEALEFGAEAILLDNMTPKEVKRSVERIKEVAPGQQAQSQPNVEQQARWIPTEASGGIVLDNIRAYAETGVDFISVGALTHSARAADISMSIAAEPS
jgi:nicotinate-nucleotide pyrophosphorylase (carboxylating)